jgi:putative transposase
MPRRLRVTDGGLVYHALNRSNGRLRLFETDGDYLAFEAVLAEAMARTPLRLIAYCIMPNHWHLVLWPEADGALSDFVGWLTLTHTQRWHAAHETVGSGHIYQGRFKSFPVQEDRHLLNVCRYVERNPLRAGLVPVAEHWRWSSLWHWWRGDAGSMSLLSEWPVERPPDWIRHVNEPLSPAELASVRGCATRERPYGGDAWLGEMVTQYGLQSSLRSPGRPRRKTVSGTVSVAEP